jgi:preprotein translocase subunit SecY
VARHQSARRAEGSSDALGGTSVLIGAGVALGTIRQMESQMLERRHESFLTS